MIYSILTQNGESVITAIIPGDPNSPYLAASDHPNYDAIVAGVIDIYELEQDGDEPTSDEIEEVTDLFDVTTTVAKRFEKLTERVTVAHGRIFFDGDPVENALTRQLLRVLEEEDEDESWLALANFFEKVSANPNEHSKEQLFEWLNRHDCTINADGDIVFYKGVQKNEDGSLVSVASGPAIVDGEEVSGQVPNEVGSVIEMPRGNVHHDPAQGCSVGLHVANWRYAHSWARGAVLEVHVNPRDVVSVPTDSNFEKVRCCRYRIVKVLDAPYTEAVLPVDGSRDEDEHFVDIDLSFDWE